LRFRLAACRYYDHRLSGFRLNRVIRIVRRTAHKGGVTSKATQEAQQKSKNFNADAIAAIMQAEQVATLLNSEKYEDALKPLKSADKRLQAAISVDPSVRLIPVEQDVRTYDRVTSPQAVNEEVDAIGGELKSGNVQEARVRLG
jgi:hypothetical protein